MLSQSEIKKKKITPKTHSSMERFRNSMREPLSLSSVKISWLILPHTCCWNRVCPASCPWKVQATGTDRRKQVYLTLVLKETGESTSDLCSGDFRVQRASLREKKWNYRKNKLSRSTPWARCLSCSSKSLSLDLRDLQLGSQTEGRAKPEGKGKTGSQETAPNESWSHNLGHCFMGKWQVLLLKLERIFSS